MRIGKLRHRVTIETPVEGLDHRGQQIDAWITVATVWAEVADLSGREAASARQVYATASVRVTIRHRTGVTTKCRVLHGSRILYVGHVPDGEGRGRQLDLMCGETPP